ncbi:MAG: alpha-2-macroglobulin family protein, partial [Flavobacteriaceae bacterium]
MRYFLFSLVLCFSVSVFGQDYDKKWNKVYGYELDGKTLSASKEVDKIYSRAKKNKNEEQIIKAFLYQSKFILALEHDGQTKVLQNLKTEISSATPPAKAFLNYIYAQSLYAYLSKNQYMLKDRTSTEVRPDDFKLWSKEDFETEIEASFEKIIAQKESLVKIPLKNYQELIEFGRFGKNTNRNLYDFLVFEAIKYSKRPYYSHKNKKSDPLISHSLASPETFIKTDFSDFKLHKIMRLFQELESYYLENNQRENLERVWFERLKYLTLADLSDIEAYQNFAQQSQFPYYKYDALFRQAELYHQLGNRENNGEYHHKALALLDSVLNNRKQSDAFLDGEKLRKTILQKFIMIEAIPYLYYGENSRVFVKYKNIDTLNGYFYKVENGFEFDSELKTYERDSLVLGWIKTKKPEKTFQTPLPDRNDYLFNSTEVLLPLLERGTYLFVAGDAISKKEEDFSFGYTFVAVTDISFQQAIIHGNNHFRILHRKTGQPLEGAAVYYNNTTKKTDQWGEVAFESKEKTNRRDSVVIQYQDNYYSESFYDYSGWNGDDDEEWTASAEIYTDRAIYRPGQPLYYKVILYENKNGEKSVVPNVYLTVEFQDDNYTVLHSERIKTNEFGSFSGEFMIPKNIATGDLTIEVMEDDDYENDEAYDEEEDEHPFWDYVDFNTEYLSVKVEEYKRPTFEITFIKETDNYVVNDSVIVKGKAQSFSGAMVSGANVNYKIYRNSRYSKPYYGSYLYDNEQIDFGEVITDSQGNFEIKFKAIPPRDEIEKDGLPVFTYTVYADVTDTQGETQEANHSIKLGYHNLELDLNVPEEIKAEGSLQITAISTNLNGKFIATDLKLEIYKSAVPKKLQLARKFSIPESPSIAKEDFEALFPYEPYAEPELTEEELVYSETFNTNEKTTISLNKLKNWKSGDYTVKISATDAYSEKEITQEGTFTLTNLSDNLPPGGKVFQYVKVNNDFKKDGYIRYKLSKAVEDNLVVFIEAFAYTPERKDQNIYKNVVSFDQNHLLIDIPVENNLEGSIETYFNFAWENNNYTFTDQLYFPPKSFYLSTEVVSMTNKLEPNASQTWSFVLKNQDGEGQIAEVLASMYDKSLDAFDTNEWRDLKRNSYRKNYFQYYQSDYYQDKTHLRVYFKNLGTPYSSRNLKNDQFNWFGYHFTDFKIDKKYYYEFLKTKEALQDTRLITGVVTASDGLGLPGVNVTVKGTTRGVQTDLDGYFEINANIGDILILSFTGMKTVELLLESRYQYDNIIELVEDNTLDVVYVEGYRTTSRALSNVAAVASEEGDIVLDNTHSEIVEVLKGQVPGLNIVASSGQPGANATVILKGSGSINGKTNPLYVIDGVPLSEEDFRELNSSDIVDVSVLKDAGATAIYGARGANGVIIITTKKGMEALSQVQTRQNLKETAFFFPHITTDKNGNLSFNFTSPESLTQWKFRMMSHTKNLLSGYFESVVTTQKELMIQPNMPRFVRETDTIIIKARIANLSADVHNGMAMLQLFDPITGENIDKITANKNNVKSFATQPKTSETLSWTIYIPKGLQGLEYKITAKAGNFTDGEQSIIPVLSSRIFITESLPIWVKENSKKDFVFENLKNNTSATLENHSFTLEYTSNPTWIAIGALPYLMEYQHECSEQLFARYYANILAHKILDDNPKIKEVLEHWSKNPTSKLEQNQELKNILLSETPWVRQAQSQEEQKKNLAILFDVQKMTTSSAEILDKLKERQNSSGSFSWFEGGSENRFITTHIAIGFGHLKKLGISDTDTDEITQNMITYLDTEFQKTTDTYFYNDLHYLYARSFYPEIPVFDNLVKKIDQRTQYFKENWLTLSLYEKAMLALILHRNSDTKTAKKILEHFKES